MITDYIFIAVALIGTAIGTFTDFKERIVPDYVNYFMILFGLSGHILISAVNQTIWPAIYSGAAAGIVFGIVYLLYHFGIWGGGDAKLLVGIAALLPVFTTQAPWPWLLTLWVNCLVFSAIFGFFGSFYLAFKYRQKFLAEFKSLVKKNKIIVYISPALLTLPVAFFLLNLPLEISLFSFLIILFPFLYLILKSVENACMYKYIAPNKLVEGDWIAENVSVGNYSYKPLKSGIEKKDILKLIELEKSGKLKHIKVKEGLPMVPAILIGLIFSIFYGDLMFSVIMGFLI